MTKSNLLRLILSTVVALSALGCATKAGGGHRTNIPPPPVNQIDSGPDFTVVFDEIHNRHLVWARSFHRANIEAKKLCKTNLCVIEQFGVILVVEKRK